MLAVLVKCGRADAAQISACKRRLQKLSRADRALALSRADDGVQLINEDDDAPLARRDLAQHGLQPLLEFTAVLRAREQLPNIQRNDARLPHRLGTVAVDNANGQSLGNRSLANARLADEHGIVLRPPRKHLHTAANLFVASDHRINLSLLRLLNEVDAVLLERLVVRLCVLVGDIGHARRFADRLNGGEHALAIESERRKHFFRATFYISKRQHQMLARDIRVLHLQRVALGGGKDLSQFARRTIGGTALHARKSTQFSLRNIKHARRIDASLLQQRRCRRSLLRQQRCKQMQRHDLWVSRAIRRRLGGG